MFHTIHLEKRVNPLNHNYYKKLSFKIHKINFNNLTVKLFIYAPRLYMAKIMKKKVWTLSNRMKFFDGYK